MVEWLRKLDRTPNSFERLILQIVEAQNTTITELKNEIQYLRDERRELQQLFNRALKLEPEVRRVKELQEAAAGLSTTRSWPRLQRELEAKHAKKSEDRVHDYWKSKAAEMAHDAGLDAASEETQDGRD